MNTLVIKKWIDGAFHVVRKYTIDEVKQIRHHKDGIEIVTNNIRLFDNQCIIEFK